MKIGNRPNYVVQVFRGSDHAEPDEVGLYDGIFTVTLNIAVEVAFVPPTDLDRPPWPAGRTPPIDRLATQEQVRWYQLISGPYSVTPDAARAGTTGRFHTPDGVGTVFFAPPGRFATFLDELAGLRELTDSPGRSPVRDDVLDRDVIRFIDGTVLDSPHLTPEAAAIVGRSRA